MEDHNETLDVSETRSSLKRPSLLPLGDDELDTAVYGASHFGQFGEYMRRKRAKLQIQNATLVASSGDETSIFTGLSIHINGWTQPSVQELRQLIVQNGGTFQPYLDKKSIVTHIVTCSLTPAKLREFKDMKVVLPAWIVDSAKGRRLLPWQDYRYSQDSRPPGVQGKSIEQGTLSFSASSKQPKLEPSALNFVLADSNKTTTSAENSTDAPCEVLESRTSVPYAADPSNFNAQKVLANPEWRRAHTSAAPDFVEGYYRNSRLHYLSTWKTELRVLIAEAQEGLERASQIPPAEPSGGVSSPGTPSKSGSVHDGERRLLRSPQGKLGLSETALPLIKGHDLQDHRDLDSQRVIMHCDFDCFFVSVGLITRPHLRGKPVVVCHSQGTQGGASSTSEVASASYEARGQGVRNGMSLQQARKLCPNILTMPYEFDRYRQLSLQFYSILLQHADDIQAVSVDEALIDVTSAVKERCCNHCTPTSPKPCIHDLPKQLAEGIRTDIRDATGCEVSIGISHNILLSRLATRHAKPAGSFHISSSNKTSEEILEFLSPLDITDLPGFGSAAKTKALQKFGSSNIGQLREFSKDNLCAAFGPANGTTLWGFVRGVDNRHLERDGGRRSVSCEINYGIRFANDDEAEAFMYQMAKEVKKRLDDAGMRGSLLTLKVLKRSPSAPIEPPKFLGCGKCDSFTKQVRLLGPNGQATNDDQTIAEHAWRLLKSFRFEPEELRGVGIQIQRLEPDTKGKAKSTAQGQTTLSFARLEANAPNPCQKAKTGYTTALEGHEKLQEGIAREVEPQLPTQASFNMYDTLSEATKEELDEKLGLRAQSSVCSSLERSHSNDTRKQNHNRQTLKRRTPPRTSRASLSPQKSDLHQKLKPKSSGLHIPDLELHSLGIDPVVFSDLPEQVQREQLTRAKLRQEEDFPDLMKKRVLKPRRSSVAPGEPRSYLSAPTAKFREPQPLRQHARSGEKLHLEATEEVQSAIGDWIAKYRLWAPKEKDVRFFAQHLLRCVNSNMGDDGIEKVTAVMKWWLILLRRFWGAQEGGGTPAGQEADNVGEAWWQVFRSVKEELDVEVRRKYGGSISLK